MYRRTLALLWTGAGISLILAALNAAIGFATEWRGLFLACMATCFVSAILRISTNRLNKTAVINRGKSEQIRGDVDQLRGDLAEVRGQVGEVRDLTEAHALIAGAHQPTPRSEPVPERDARIYQFRLRCDSRDGIAGSLTSRDLTDEEHDQVWQALDANDTGTLPGTSAS